MNVEVGEEDDEGYSVPNESIVHPFGEVAVNVERVDGMHDGQSELQLCVCVWEHSEGLIADSLYMS